MSQCIRIARQFWGQLKLDQANKSFRSSRSPGTSKDMSLQKYLHFQLGLCRPFKRHFLVVKVQLEDFFKVLMWDVTMPQFLLAEQLLKLDTLFKSAFWTLTEATFSKVKRQISSALMPYWLMYLDEAKHLIQVNQLQSIYTIYKAKRRDIIVRFPKEIYLFFFSPVSYTGSKGLWKELTGGMWEAGKF